MRNVLLTAILGTATAIASASASAEDRMTDLRGQLVSLQQIEGSAWKGVIHTDLGDYDFYTKDGALAFIMTTNRDYPLRVLCVQDDWGCNVETIFIN